MSDTKTRSRPAPDYDADFYAWTRDQAARLRELRPNSLDWENVAEEIESVGRSERKEIRSRLLVLLTHLLKWACRPEERSNSWRASIREARYEIADVIKGSPSLKSYPATQTQRVYELARMFATDETGLPERAFPEKCPFAIRDILDVDFLPEALPE